MKIELSDMAVNKLLEFLGRVDMKRFEVPIYDEIIRAIQKAQFEQMAEFVNKMKNNSESNPVK